MEMLSAFEKGVLMALVSITATLRSTPGFDGDALTKAAQRFIDDPAQGCSDGASFEAYEWPLCILTKDLSQLQNFLNADKVRN
ncbi:hypothetical protein HU746_18150 [Pseudomonas lurida]|uniref:Uncharacterized protein n=1 Tax=Pseudomonas pergaminensis TaxID=2853159 RepID=A0ABW8QYD0_9PSED|nr:hypothetical protein [Pseudomonas lurida]MBC3246574.1 hypothetical protein [Pseudomonas lurida]